ncbi:MAG: C10 family peptidase [Planctomycetota bacterium]|nr:C10 family peptidase [Planctomycetota bacterium]
MKTVNAARRRAWYWTRMVLVCLCVFLLPVQMVLADQVSADRAEVVARGHLKKGDKPLGANISKNVKGVKTFTDDRGAAIYYVVSLQPEGYVILAADDWIEPIIAFSSVGEYDPSPGNPLWVLLNRDMKQRVDTVRLAQTQSGAMCADSAKAKEKWTALNICGDGEPLAGGIAGVSDVRVAPLIQSRWSQSTASGQPCYNYYTPNGYVCGCVATAMAQLMRYYQYPVQPTALGPYTIYIAGVEDTRSLRGGDGVGGPYDWANMPLIPSAGVNETQRQAIGALCFDAGVAAHMQYNAGGSAAYMSDASTALMNTFGYGNSVRGANYSPGISTAVLQNMINTNLDGGLPVLLGIYNYSENIGHAIVCDGYGIDAATWYHHLNLGWAGSSDAWYNLPTVDCGYNFNSVGDCLYNIRTAGAGEVVSGRITDMNGNPVSGATVTATRSGGGVYVANTTAAGIYALVGVPPNSTYTVSPSKGGFIFVDQIANTTTSISGGTTCGNKWGVNFVGASAGALLTQSGGSTNVVEGGATDSYTVVLITQPTADVIITVTPNAEVTVNPTTLTFTNANWNVAQTVTVTAVNDGDLEWDHTGSVGHTAVSADPVYNGVVINSVTVYITDDEAGGVLTAEITAGTGGQLWGNGANNPEDPFNTYYHDSRSQTVILASELTAAGMTPNASIVQLRLRCYQVHGRPNLKSFRIRLQHTASATSTALVSAGWTEVFGPTDVVTTAGQWMFFMFSTPFVWNGGDNIYVDLTRDDTAWANNGGMYVRTGLTNRTFAGRADSASAWPFNTGLATEQQNSIPEIKFDFLEDTTPEIAVVEIVSGVGGGIWGNDSTNAEDPFNTEHHDSRSQTVILASELRDLGLNPGAQIAQLQLRCSQVHGRPNLANFRIRMRHTTDLASTSFITSGWTLVYGPTACVTTAGDWFLFTFSAPFIWNGANNIYVELSRDDSAWATGGGMFVRTGLPNRTFAGYSDSISSWPFDTGLLTEQQNAMPEMKLGYVVVGGSGLQTAELTPGTAGGIWGNGASNPEDPFNTNYHDSRSQTLVKASELTAAGMSAGASIMQLQFRCYQLHGRPNLANFRIRLQHTGATTSTAFVTSGWSDVFGPTDVVTVAGQWITFNLSAPFTWNGTGNIYVDLTRDDSAWAANGGMYVRTGLTNRTFAGYSQSASAWPFDTGLQTEQQNTIPEMRFKYINAVVQYPLTWNVNPPGCGTVTRGPVGSNPGATSATGTSDYDSGTTVAVSANPAAEYQFASWTGPVTIGPLQSTVAMDSAKSITANFALVQYALNWSVSPGGGGTVTRNPLGTNAVSPSASGSSNYDSGTVVTVTANPATGYTFVSWTGPVANPGDQATTVTMGAARTITANFALIPYELTWNVNPGGTGTVLRSLLGTNLVSPSANGSADYDYGTVLTVTASPAAGYQFSSWAGPVANPAAQETTVTVDADKSITANFVLIPYALTWGVNLVGSGTVSRNPLGTNGVSPSTSGTSDYDNGTVVTVTANANAGYAFASWTGPVANPAAQSTTVNMTQARNITANFSDTAPPQIEITGPTSEVLYFTTQSTVNLAGTASDNQAVTNVTWQNTATGANGAAVGTTSWTIAGIALIPGLNLIQVGAWDAAGLSGTDAIQVVRAADVHWPLNENAGGIATDVVSGRVGTLVGAAWLAPGSPGGGSCLQFDGGDCVTTNYGPAWSTANSFTAWAWVRTVGAAPQTVFGFSTAGSGAMWLRITAVGRPEFVIRDDAGTEIVALAATAVNDGAWHHVACRRRTDAHMIDIFIDGQLPCVSVADTTAVPINAGPQKTLVIGAVNSVGPVEPFTGDIDAVRIYPGALTDQQIANAAAGVVNVNINLAIGWNLISLPVEPLTPYLAEDLAQLINAQGGACTQVMKWNPGWLVHPVPSGTNNFAIEVGYGYFVRCTAPSTLTLQGLSILNVTIQANAGWTLVGVPLAGYTAEQLGQEINTDTGAGNCTQIMKWNPGWLVHPVPSGVNNFNIDPGCGYFVKTTVGGPVTLP